MQQEIIEWFSIRHLEPHKLISKGHKRGISKANTEAAMEHCYNKIIHGKRVPDIDIARYVWNVARDIDGTEYAKQNKSLEFLTGELTKHTEQVQLLEKQLDERVTQLSECQNQLDEYRKNTTELYGVIDILRADKLVALAKNRRWKYVFCGAVIMSNLAWGFYFTNSWGWWQWVIP